MNCQHCHAELVQGKEGPVRFLGRRFCNRACTLAARASGTLICRTPGDMAQVREPKQRPQPKQSQSTPPEYRAQYVMRDGKRVLEDPAITAARIARFEDRMPWPELESESEVRLRSSLTGEFRLCRVQVSEMEAE